MKLAPKTATVVRDGAEVTVPVEQVQTGDVFVVRPGESIPVDGVVLDGTSAVNEAALTGESIPADKAPGASVSAATVNQSGFLNVPRHARRARTRPSRRSSRWSATRRPPRRRLPRLPTRCPACSCPSVIAHRARDDHRLAAARPAPWATRWRAASPCWSSAARARWAWPRRWRSWSAAAWARRTASSSRRRPRLEETGQHPDRRARQDRHHHLRRARR